MHVIAAKAVGFGENLKPDYKEYCKQIVKNASALSQRLVELGYKLVSGGTDNHLMLVDLSNKDITGKAAEKALEKAGITVNKNMVPFDKRSPFITSGIRIGTPAMTTRGMKEPEMKQIADMINTVLSNIDNDSVIEKVRNQVSELCGKFKLYDID